MVWRNVPDRTDVPGRVLPDGCMDLMWSGGLVVAGPDTRAQETAPGSASYTGLRFEPGAGPLVFGVPAHELRDLRVPLEQLWPSTTVRELAERVAAAPDQGAALEAVAGRRLLPAKEPVPWHREAAIELARGTGVARVASQVGLSERQLRRRCLDAFGYGPKTLARVLRMRRALGLARAGMTAASVAAVVGYADQAHLAREVKALAGVPLSQLL